MNAHETVILAFQHHAAGRLAEAEGLYRQVLAADPADVDALHGLARLAHQVGRHDDAGKLIRRAIVILPGELQLQLALTMILQSQGRLDDAMVAAADGAARFPRSAEALSNLGALLQQQGRKDDAIRAYRAALAIDPQHPGANNNLGELLRENDRPAEAIPYYDRGLQGPPAQEARARNNLGLACLSLGRVDEAIAHLRRAVELGLGPADAPSNLLHALHYSRSATAAQIAEEHARWARVVESSLPPPVRHSNVRDPARRLRIGYVSGDFRSHAISFFIEPILAHHHREQFEIFCYAAGNQSDRTSQHLQSLCDGWRSLHHLSDDAAAALIRADAIDILVDLSVHSTFNRLSMFARKPAPVQMTYLGYPGSTGLREIDYRITTADLESPDLETSRVSIGPERPLLLPQSYFCYQPPEPSPPIGESPAARNGFVTFGSINRLSKIGDRVLDVWSQLLRAVPKSRLLMTTIGFGEEPTRRAFAERFAARGIASDRLDLRPEAPLQTYLATIAEADIALDPFPFNGGTSTLHTLWMGVPVITLAGQLPVGRMGLNILNTLGLPDLVADAEKDYIVKAAALAGDQNRLAELRRTMRDRLSASPLMQAGQFTSNLESLYRQAWTQYCTQT